jgi:hypothetical protein
MAQLPKRVARLVGVACLEGVNDARMEGALPLGRQAAVGNLVGERVLERVLGLGRSALLVEELGRLEPGDALAQGVIGAVLDGDE